MVHPAAGPRLLIVDDNRDAADSLALLFGLWGYHPCVAYDGPTALDLARATQPDAVLLDLGLPGMDGFQLAAGLRGVPGGDSLPLIAVTGYATAVHRTRARTTGFDHFLVKPVDPSRLRSVLDTLLRVRLLAVRMDGLARRHAELARESAGLLNEARRQTEALRQALADPSAD